MRTAAPSPPAPHAAAAQPPIFATLEETVAAAAEDERALIAARDEWEVLAGKVHDDEPLYEERAGAFLEWFTFDRPGAEGVPPVELQIAARRDVGDEAGAALRIALAASHRSLFRVRELRADGLLLDDLWTGALLHARERRRLPGVAPSELIDLRLVADPASPPDLLITRIACVHPRGTGQAIARLLAASQKAGEDRRTFLFRLLRLRVRCERYQHVSPVRVYSAGEVEREPTLPGPPHPFPPTPR